MMAMKTSRGSAGFEKCVSVTHLLATIVGVWPLDEHRSLLRRSHFLFPASVIVFFTLIPQIRKVIIEHRNFNVVIEVLSLAIITEGICLLKLLALWYNKQDLRKLLIQIHKDWIIKNDQEKVIMWTNAEFTRWIAIFSIFTTFGALTFYGFVYLLTVRIHLSQENSTTPKPLFLKSYFPFDTHYTPMYEIVCLFQYLGAAFATFAYSSFDSLFFCCILHFNAQLYNLKQRIKHIVNEHIIKNIKFTKVLESIIRDHQHLIRYTYIIENNFNKVFLVQVLWSSIALCLQSYQLVMIITESDSKLLANLIFIVMYILCILASIFFYCYVADIMRTESLSLFYAVYDTQWYELVPQDSRLLLILMNRYMLPIEITVGKFSVFSLGYFASVMKTSVGYLSMLLTVKQKIY